MLMVTLGKKNDGEKEPMAVCWLFFQLGFVSGQELRFVFVD